ncbi:MULTISPECIES: RDD family protein [unclassified Schlesneria]|uniref:RDD family protein n=1 Tax=unclassified Schlesneria TaxID=2762017 RepID=UPI002F1C8BCA
MTRQQRVTVSGVKTGDQRLLLLVREHLGTVTPTSAWPTELVDVDLNSGAISTSKGPDGVRYAVYGGGKLWLLPDVAKGTSPFVCEGTAWAILRRAKRKGVYSHRAVVQYIDPHWRDTGRVIESPAFRVGNDTYIGMQGEHSFWFQAAIDGLYYQRDLRPIDEKDVGRKPENNDEILGEGEMPGGWNYIPIDDDSEEFSRVPLAYWFKSDQPCSLEIESTESESFRFMYRRYLNSGRVYTQAFLCPIRWLQDEQLSFQYGENGGCMHIIPDSDGTALAAALNGIDGRLHVFKVTDGQPKLVGQRGSPKVRWLLQDIGCFVLLAFCAPLLPLMAVAWIDQFTQMRRIRRDADRNAMAPCIVQRGIARAIDLGLMLPFAVGAVAYHPDFIGWWLLFARECQRFVSSIQSVFDIFHFTVIDEMKDASVKVLALLFEVQVEWRMVTVVLFLSMCQLIMMGRYGQSIGKKLCGIRIVRPTLRRCEFGRLVLREVLLPVDTFMLTMWWPALLVMFLTPRSQRLGDIVANTIVITVRKSPIASR